jgi:acyl-CoA reductase-like NAD-dependent aldehyde dehydrogenase
LARTRRLALSGNGPFNQVVAYVLPATGTKLQRCAAADADREQRKRERTWHRIVFSGQACAGTRLLVPRKRLEAAKRAMADAIRAFPVSDPADPRTAVGTDGVAEAVRARAILHSQGYKEGAEVMVGGEGRPEGLETGCFVKPAVFVNMKNDMTIAREEIFVHVLSVIAYDSEDEAISIANDSKYGLHAAVIGTDRHGGRWKAALDDHLAPLP